MAKMTISSGNGKNVPRAVAWLSAGILLLAVAWMVPVSLKSVTPAVLKRAGENTPSVAQFGRLYLDSEKLGPAQLMLDAARLVDDSGAPALDRGIRDMETRRPEWVAWGGWDPFLDPLFNLKGATDRKEATPVLTFFITSQARQNLRNYLSNTRSLGVQSLLQTRDIDRTTQFVPARRAGGQTLDAVILLAALLYQGEHLSQSLQRELRTLADTAVAQKEMGELEPFYLDLLSLGKRLNWIQLCELLRITDSTKTVGEYAHLSRVAPDNLPLIYTAALFSDSADKVAIYLIQFGKSGVDDLRFALGLGQGAVSQLLLVQAPINRKAGPAFGVVTELALIYPRMTLILKYLGFLLGAFCIFRGLEREFINPLATETPLRVKSSALAILTAGLLILATEPFLLKAAPLSEFRLKLTLPVLANLTNVQPAQSTANSPTMESTTILSIVFFASLQIGMYMFCLRKIREISRQPLSPLVKLRLMENEENLFDGGLYIGIGGTAAALVLQVLKVIDPNLLAAYSSNLFGITCVALVKIRHVRPFKRQLILDGQNVGPAMPASLVAPVPMKVPVAPAPRPAVPTPPPAPPTKTA